MIDVHIIKHPTEDRSENFEKLLASLENEPVDVHIVEGVAGNIGAGRAEGFRRGSNPWVSFIDDDDAIAPGVFHAAIKYISENPWLSGFCTREIGVHDGIETPAYPEPRKTYNINNFLRMHHLLVLKRSEVLPHLDQVATFNNLSESGLLSLMMLKGAEFGHCPIEGYYWRTSGGTHSAASIPVPENVQNLLKQIKMKYKHY